MTKLNQVLAVWKGSKARASETGTKAYHAVQKPSLFTGLSKTYKPTHEENESLPPEHQMVQMTVRELLHDVQKEYTNFFDVSLTRDYANQEASADIVVDGQPIATDVPAPYLLFLEKQLTDLRTFFNSLPVLDPTEAWSFDGEAQLYKSKPVSTMRTKKVQKPIVLYDATDKHPAQTQLITEDVNVGVWETAKVSGAIPAHEKRALVDRVQVLLEAVHKAREAANIIDAKEQYIGKAIFNYLTGQQPASKAAA